MANEYEEIVQAEREQFSSKENKQKGNVLVIGNSGVGKSTLINAVLGVKRAKACYGIHGTTVELKSYETENVPFRLVDTIGFEPGAFKKDKAIQAVKKWGAEATKEAEEKKNKHQINVIWFCVDGTSSKLFPSTIKDFFNAASMWRSVPVIVVITKSYSVPDRQKNIDMVNEAFTLEKAKKKITPAGIIPVVAEAFVLNMDDPAAQAPPEGISELIELTNRLMPKGIKEADKIISKHVLNRKRAFAHSAVGLFTTSGAAVGAIPIPMADAPILAGVELGEIKTLAKIYEIKKDGNSEKLFSAIVKAGTISAAAKSLISAVKAIPGINLAAAVVNAVVAGCIVAAIGEATIYAFEQIYLGKKSLLDVDWIKSIVEDKLTNVQFVDKVKEILSNIKVPDGITDKSSKEDILKALAGVIPNIAKSVQKRR